MAFKNCNISGTVRKYFTLSLPSIENKISKLQVKLKQRHVQVSSLKDTLKVTNQIRIYTHTHIYTYIVHKLSYLNFIQLSIY